jgi:hypothetical protein
LWWRVVVAGMEQLAPVAVAVLVDSEQELLFL